MAVLRKTLLEHDIKARIMDYLNLPENEYGLVFTVSRGSAFKLLAESYPFQTNKKLLTMFDYESQSMNWMVQSAREKGAKVYSAWFKWPTLKLCSTDLRKQITNKKKKKKDVATGLFVFPVQNCKVLSKNYRVRWTLSVEDNLINIGLEAAIRTMNYMAFGWANPNSTFVLMLGVDVAVAGFKEDGMAFVNDFYIIKYSECSLYKDGEVNEVYPDTKYEGSGPNGKGEWVVWFGFFPVAVEWN
ncbi:hypothetical protein ACFX2I_001862 [Malus domestica]